MSTGTQSRRRTREVLSSLARWVCLPRRGRQPTEDLRDKYGMGIDWKQELDAEDGGPAAARLKAVGEPSLGCGPVQVHADRATWASGTENPSLAQMHSLDFHSVDLRRWHTKGRTPAEQRHLADHRPAP